MGAEFYAEVETVKGVLLENPYSFEVKYRTSVRWIKTDRFPYIVVYVINGENVVIIAVVSTYQHPKIWKGRT